MDVRLPKLGEGAESGAVVSLLVKEGDTITKGQIILEIENEKAVAAVPSSESGKIGKINVKVGDKVSVGQVIMTLEGGAGAAAPAPAPAKAKAVAPAKAKPAAVARPAAEPAAVEEAADYNEEEESAEEGSAAKAGLPVAAAPSLRRIAFDLGIDLAKIRGSGDGGRILTEDLRNYIQRLRAAASRGRAPVASAPAPSAAVAAPAYSPFQFSAPESIDFSKWGPVTRKPMASIRQTIAKRMVENAVTLPHVTQFDQADITALLDLRKKYLAAYEAKGARLTVTTLLLKAVAVTLKKFPIFNASVDEVTQEIVFKDYVHLGMAVDTEQGLLVPVLRDVDKKDLVTLCKDLHALAEKARDRKISLEEMRGGTFTISNQGAIGGGHFTPIINKPEVAILGLGKTALQPWVMPDKSIAARSVLPVSLSYDHRIIDGGEAARFTVELMAQFQNFQEEFVKI